MIRSIRPETGLLALSMSCFALAALSSAESPANRGRLETAEVLVEDGQFSQALELLDRMDDGESFDDGRRLLVLARALNEVGDWRRAVEIGERVAEVLPRSSAARLQYAIALRNKMGEVGPFRAMASLGDYKRELAAALELDPANLDAVEERIGYLINAPGIAGGDKDEARRKIDELTEVDELRGLTMKGVLLQDLEDLEGSIAIFERVLEIEPARHQTRYSLGMALQDAERWEASDAQFERLLELDSGSRYRLAALYQLGRSRILGRFDQQRAVEHFDDFLSERGVAGGGNPGRADALWRRGMALEQLGRASEAIDSYRLALADQPDHSQAKKALRRID